MIPIYLSILFLALNFSYLHTKKRTSHFKKQRPHTYRQLYSTQCTPYLDIYLFQLYNYINQLLITMINAVLVFNNSGQPRLTKFYTQLVRYSPPPTQLNVEQKNNIKAKKLIIRLIHTPHRILPSNNVSSLRYSP